MHYYIRLYEIQAIYSKNVGEIDMYFVGEEVTDFKEMLIAHSYSQKKEQRDNRMIFYSIKKSSHFMEVI